MFSTHGASLEIFSLRAIITLIGRSRSTIEGVRESLRSWRTHRRNQTQIRLLLAIHKSHTYILSYVIYIIRSNTDGNGAVDGTISACLKAKVLSFVSIEKIVSFVSNTKVMSKKYYILDSTLP